MTIPAFSNAAPTTSPLWQARYYKSAFLPSQLPETLVPEIVFAGRSNAGKSSAINVLCQQKRLAFASKTPGRTHTINFYSIGGGHVAQHRNDAIDETAMRGLLVDLPGYGYAAVDGPMQEKWRTLLTHYMTQRRQIAGLVLVMDARHPMQDLDRALLDLFSVQQKPLLLLLTKADKLSSRERQVNWQKTQAMVTEHYANWGASITVQFFSVLKREGLRAADALINQWINTPTEL